MTWPIVALAFWNPGDGRDPVIDDVLADPRTPLATHGLTGIAAAYARETGAGLHELHRAWVRHLGARSLGVDGALCDVVSTFDAHGFDYFVAKGPVIAHTRYPHPGLRPYCDLDVYVARRHHPAARRALQGSGYDPVEHAPGVLGGLAQELHGGRFGATVELHAHVVDNLHRRHLPPIDAFLPYVRRELIAGVSAPVLRRDADLALQAIHAAAGHRYQKLVLLRDLAGTPGHVPTELGAGSYLSMADDVLARLGRAGPSPTTGGTLRRPLGAALARHDPQSWDEHALSAANVLALLHQQRWRTTVQVALLTAASIRPRRSRRVDLCAVRPMRRAPQHAPRRRAS